MNLTYNKFSNFKYLSVFIERLIPSFWLEKYPKFTLFIKYFFEYLEQNGKTYHDIAHIMDFVDIEAIGNLTQTGTDLDRKEQLLRQIYIQYLGSENATALVDLISDEIRYIENQKYVNSRKGIKANFLYFFLLVLGGYFKITEITNTTKIHDGTYSYDGSITYNNESTSIVPYTYLIISEFNLSAYQTLADNLNPAGMKYLSLLQKHLEYTIGPGDESDIDTVYNYPNIYFGIYNSTTLVGIVKPSRVKYSEIVTGSTYDFIFQNGDKIMMYDSNQTGVDSLFYETAFNTSFFTGTQFNKIKILSNPLVTGPIPAYDIWHDGSSIVSEGTVVYIVNLDNTMDVQDNTQIALLIKGF